MTKDTSNKEPSSELSDVLHTPVFSKAFAVVALCGLCAVGAVAIAIKLDPSTFSALWMPKPPMTASQLASRIRNALQRVRTEILRNTDGEVAEVFISATRPIIEIAFKLDDARDRGETESAGRLLSDLIDATRAQTDVLIRFAEESPDKARAVAFYASYARRALQVGFLPDARHPRGEAALLPALLWRSGVWIGGEEGQRWADVAYEECVRLCRYADPAFVPDNRDGLISGDIVEQLPGLGSGGPSDEKTPPGTVLEQLPDLGSGGPEPTPPWHGSQESGERDRP